MTVQIYLYKHNAKKKKITCIFMQELCIQISFMLLLQVWRVVLLKVQNITR